MRRNRYNGFVTVDKVYCFVDETGQDTQGRLFIVAIVVIGKERDKLLTLCEKLEKESGKGKFKWGKADKKLRLRYLSGIFARSFVKEKLRYSVFRDSKDYDLATIMAIAKAVKWKEIRKKYTTLVYVDGLTKVKRREYGVNLRKLGIPIRKVQGVTKDENNPLTRLADAIAGFVRDALERQAKDIEKLFEQAVRNKVLVEV